MAASEFFGGLAARVDPARIEGINQSFRFEVEGEGTWLVDVRDGALKVTDDATTPADVTILTSAETFAKILAGRQSATTAYMTGKIKVQGDLAAAMKLQKFF